MNSAEFMGISNYKQLYICKDDMTQEHPNCDVSPSPSLGDHGRWHKVTSGCKDVR